MRRQPAKWIAISIHALRVEGDAGQTGEHTETSHFYPRPPGGGRPGRVAGDCESSDFYPRPPGGGRHTAFIKTEAPTDEFLSTPSGWRATTFHTLFHGCNSGISIHALRVEGDFPIGIPTSKSRSISIHALRVEGDHFHVCALVEVAISIHALRVEGDLTGRSKKARTRRFLSTPSGWRATVSAFTLKAANLLFLSTPSGWRATRVCSKA